MSESAAAAPGFSQIFYFPQIGLIDLLDHHLGDPISPAKGIGILAHINHGDLNLTTVVGIDSAGRIDQLKRLI